MLGTNFPHNNKKNKMEINKLYEYEKLERVTHEDGSRYYVSPTGDHLSSVTTILSATSYSPELKAWQDRVGLQEAERVRVEATGLGSLMHLHLENYVMGETRPAGNNMVRIMARQMADKVIEKGLCNVDEVWGMEEILYYPGLYAGTTDLVGIHQGKQAIMDYKTCRKRKKRSQIESYFCQAAAYAQAHNIIHRTDIKKGVIFMVSRDLEFDEFIIEGDEFDHYLELWNTKLETFLKLEEAKKSQSGEVLG